MESDKILRRRAKAKAYRDSHPEKMAEARRAHYLRHKDAVISKNAIRAKDNPGPVRAWRLKWQRNNKDRVAQANRRWQEQNLAKFAEYARFRSSLQARSIPLWYEEEQVALVYQKCAEMNEQYGYVGTEKLTVDHIIPINPRDKTVCGLHCLANLQLLAKSENSAKRDKYTTNW